MRELLRWLLHSLEMKDDRLPSIVLMNQLSGTGRPRMGLDDVVRKDLWEIGVCKDGGFQ